MSAIQLAQMFKSWEHLEKQEQALKLIRREVMQETEVILRRVGLLGAGEAEYQGEIVGLHNKIPENYLSRMFVEVNGLIVVEMQGYKEAKVGDWIRFKGKLGSLQKERRVSRNGKLPVVHCQGAREVNWIKRPNS